MITPEDILNFADGLMVGNPDEVHCRQAAARAYYSILHLARVKTGIAVSGGNSSHQQVFDELFRLRQKGTLEPCLQEALNFWSTLRDARKSADYDIADAFPAQRAQRSLLMAKKIFAQV